jgi:hypothetical protein|tara:strand:+ start:38 stop:328 length:291 start_codon:yes stop_codon:yes gene_type:complete
MKAFCQPSISVGTNLTYTRLVAITQPFTRATRAIDMPLQFIHNNGLQKPFCMGCFSFGQVEHNRSRLFEALYTVRPISEWPLTRLFKNNLANKEVQ